MTAASVPGLGAAEGAAPRIWRDPSLRMLAAGSALFGAYSASLGVHQSLIATEVFGYGDGAYAAILALAMAASVGSAVAVGIATDRHPWRRAAAGGAAAAMLLGALLVWLVPSPATFALAHVLLLPLAGSFFGQIFAVARLASLAHPEAARPGILSVLRALFAVPFVVVLPLWGLAFGRGVPLLAIYPALAAIAVALLLLVARAWPADRVAPWPQARSGQGILASLREIAAGPVLGRTVLVGVVQAGGAVGGVILGLLFARAGREAGDVGFFFASFVVVEIAATLLLAPLLRFASRTTLILAGAGLYALYLALLPLLAGSGWVWVLILPAGVGGGLIYTLAIAYLQDLLAARPGAGAALVSVQRVASEGTATLIYGAGTAAQGYALVSLATAAATTGAALLLRRVDRDRGAGGR